MVTCVNGRAVRGRRKIARRQALVSVLRLSGICTPILAVSSILSKMHEHRRLKLAVDKPDTCEICGLSFSGKQAKAQHIRSAHTNETPFQCKYCPKKFPQQSACLMHERTHTGEKPLACSICGQRFGESSNLTKHRKAHGAHGRYVKLLTFKNKS